MAGPTPRKMVRAARMLRKNSTDAEDKLWYRLRARQIGDLKFRRQHPIGPYVIDFYCPAAMLAVELDGGQHAEAAHQAADRRRESYLAKRGVTVLRFWNHQVLADIETVLVAIWQTAGRDNV